MDIIDSKTDKQLLESLIAEIAKSNNEIKCARKDVDKAQNRIKFVTMLLHKLLDRQGD